MCYRVCVVVVLGFISIVVVFCFVVFFVQAEDGIRDLVRSRGLGDVYKRQMTNCTDRRSRSSRCLARMTSYARNGSRKYERTPGPS